jgi:hypothetical protein
MRIRLIGGSVAIALVALVSSAAPSYEQCEENSRACIANPWIEPLPTVPGSPVFMLAHHHSAGHGRA